MSRGPNFHVFVPLMPAGGAVEDTTQSETKPMGHSTTHPPSGQRPCALGLVGLAVVILGLLPGPLGRNDGSGTVLRAGSSDLGQQSDPVQREALLNDHNQRLSLLCGGVCSLVSSRPHLLGRARVK